MPSKPWWQSRTIWGGLIAAIAGIIKIVAKVDVTDLTTTITDNLDAVFAVIGGIIAIYGRVRTNTTIKGSTAAKEADADAFAHLR